MQNIRLKIEGPRLFIEIDLTDNCGASNKSVVVATTKGSDGMLPWPWNMMRLQLYLTKPLPSKFVQKTS